MAQIVLLIGKSGSGKSTSLRNFKKGEVGIIQVVDKPLPFKNSIETFKSDEYAKIKAVLLQSKVKSLVIDDSGYLQTNAFMKGHSSNGKGNNVFELYNTIGDNFWDLIRFASTQLPEDKIVYFIMHEEKNDTGDIRPKTIGRMLDEKVCIEGMFTIVLRSVYSDGKYLFRTCTDGLDVTKTPIGMFADKEIDNDLKLVDDTIRSFYQIGGNE